MIRIFNCVDTCFCVQTWCTIPFSPSYDKPSKYGKPEVPEICENLSYTPTGLFIIYYLIFLSGRTEFPSPSGEQKDTTSSCEQPDHPRWTAGQPHLHCLQQEHTGAHCTPSTLQGTFKLHLYLKRLILVWLKSVHTSVPKKAFSTGLWNQAAGCSLASPAWTQEIQILFGTSNIPDWSRQVSWNISNVVAARKFLQRSSKTLLAMYELQQHIYACLLLT